MTEPADLVVWRHGRTAWNNAGLFQGQTDTPLDDVGHGQARAAAGVLMALRPVDVVSSDLARARDTAAYLDPDVDVDARLREIDVGEWSGLTREEVEERFPATYAEWLAGADVRREGGETLAEVAARAVAAVLDRFEHRAGGPLVVVTHGGAARALVLGLLGLPVSYGHAFAALGNARWATLVLRQSGWRLTAYNAGVDVPVAGEPKDDATPEPVL